MQSVPLRNEPPIVSLADLGTESSGVSLSLSKLKLKELLVEVTSHGAAVHARKNGQDAIAIRANKYVGKLPGSRTVSNVKCTNPGIRAAFAQKQSHSAVSPITICCLFVEHSFRVSLSF